MSVSILLPPVGLKQSERSVTIPSYFSLSPAQRRMVDNKQWQNLACMFRVSDQAVRNYYLQPLSASVKEEGPKPIIMKNKTVIDCPADLEFVKRFKRHLEDRKLSIKKWCAESGISFTTVRHAIANNGHMTEETRARMSQAMVAYTMSTFQ